MTARPTATTVMSQQPSNHHCEPAVVVDDSATEEEQMETEDPRFTLRIDDNGHSTLMRLVVNGNWKDVIEFLDYHRARMTDNEFKAMLNSPSVNRANTALHWAYRSNKTDIANLLLRDGADPRLKNWMGLTASESQPVRRDPIEFRLIGYARHNKMDFIAEVDPECYVKYFHPLTQIAEHHQHQKLNQVVDAKLQHLSQMANQLTEMNATLGARLKKEEDLMHRCAHYLDSVGQSMAIPPHQMAHLQQLEQGLLLLFQNLQQPHAP